MTKIAIKIRPDVAFAASGRIFLYDGTQQMLRRDVFSAGLWPVSDRICRSVKSRRYP